MSPFKRIKAWFIAEVPPELAACEFHCRVESCEHGRWAECPKRLDRELLERATRDTDGNESVPEAGKDT